MRRRALLRATAGVPALPLVGRAARGARATYAPNGSVTVAGTKEAVVDGAGRYAFLAVTDGFVVADLADPSAPEVVHENRAVMDDHEDGPLREIYDVKLDRENDLLVVLGPANPTGASALKGAAVYDVSDPTAPERVSFHETDFFNHNGHVADGTVYLCGNDGERNAVVMVDAESGERLGDWSIVDVDERWAEVEFSLWVLHDVFVQDGIAYLAQWDAGTWMVDVSDPASPELIARVRGRPIEEFLDMASDEARREAIEPPGNDHYVAVDESGDLLGISVESWDGDGDGEGGPGGVTLYDVSDPESPEELSFVAPPPTADPTFPGTWTTSHNFEFRGEKLYTSWYEGGVKLHDVSDPANPQHLAHWRSEDTSFWTARSATEEMFVAASRMNPARSDRKRDGAALYTFPVVDEQVTTPESQASPPTSTPTRTPTAAPTGTRTVTATPESTETTTATETGTATATDATTPEGSSGSGPGFGALGALGALGLGAYRYVRSGSDREE